MKIIHILCHTTPLRDYLIFDGWSARVAKYIKKYAPYYHQECWFAVDKLAKNRISIKDGITYKLYRSWTLSKALESFFGIIISKDLISDLKKEIKKNSCIIHIQGERSLLVWQVIQAAGQNPIVLQVHGYSTPKSLQLFEKFIFAPREKFFLKNVDHFFSSIKYRTDYFINELGISPDRILNQNLGVDYDIFKPVDKMKVRKRLSLPLDKNIILYVGNFTKTKGVEKIIAAHLNLKEKENTFLILIGGLKLDEYYKYCVDNADLVLERIPHSLLPKYYAISDVYCMVCSEDKARYGGLGIASMEAVACNVPILNSNLDDAPVEIRDKIGFKVRSVEELVDKIKYILKNKDKYKNIRDLSKPYFSWEGVIKSTLRVYEELAAKIS